MAKVNHKAEKSTSSNMENVMRLQECHKRNITFKQAFFNRGMTDDSIPLKQLSAKEEFSTLVNWARHELPKYEDMELRADMEGVIYQTTLHKDQRQIRVGEITKKYGPGAIRYDWLPGTNYYSLDLGEIKASIWRADMINDAKMKGQELTQEMILQHTETQAAEASGAMSVMPRVPSIKMRETEKNCWEVVLTEEERELINEFLET